MDFERCALRPSAGLLAELVDEGRDQFRVHELIPQPIQDLGFQLISRESECFKRRTWLMSSVPMAAICAASTLVSASPTDRVNPLQKRFMTGKALDVCDQTAARGERHRSEHHRLYDVMQYLVDG
jgi:hypothetical protein